MARLGIKSKKAKALCRECGAGKRGPSLCRTSLPMSDSKHFSWFSPNSKRGKYFTMSLLSIPTGRKFTHLVCGIFLLFILSSCSDSNDSPRDQAPDDGPAVWGRFERTLPIAVDAANPFDPSEVTVDVELIGPDDQRKTVPAFFYRGFLRIPEGAKHLEFEDGTPFFAVGENVAWADQRGSGAYEDWIAKLAASGANYIRAWMPEWDMGLLYEPVWQLPEIDFVQLHSYQIHSIGLVYPLADTIFRLVDRMAQYGKPVLLAEAGVDIQGLERTAWPTRKERASMTFCGQVPSPALSVVVCAGRGATRNAGTRGAVFQPGCGPASRSRREIDSF